MERFNLNKLNEGRGEVKYRVEVLNRFTSMEDLDSKGGDV
jgi:hypothetical protein